MCWNTHWYLVYVVLLPWSVPSVLWRCLLGGRKGIRPVKNWVVGCWHGYLSGARCRLAYGQLMPLALTVSCFSEIQIGFTFLVPAHLGSPGKRAVKRGVCVPLSIEFTDIGVLPLLLYSHCVLVWWKTVDTELRGKREELHLLRQNELNMELRVEAGHNHLVQLMKFLRTNQSDLDEVVCACGLAD